MKKRSKTLTLIFLFVTFLSLWVTPSQTFWTLGSATDDEMEIFTELGMEIEWNKVWDEKQVGPWYHNFVGKDGGLYFSSCVGNPFEGEYDIFVLQANDQGQFTHYADWDDATDPSQELSYDMDVEGSFIYTCGSAYNSTVLIKWNKVQASPVWIKRFYNEIDGNIYRVAACGDFVYGLTTFPGQTANKLIKWNTDGSKIWERNLFHQVEYMGYPEFFHGDPVLLHADSLGISAVLSSGINYNGTSYYDSTLYRYDQDGNELWMRETNNSMSGAYADGSALYLRNWYGYHDYVASISKWNHMGEVEWNHTLDNPEEWKFRALCSYKNSVFSIQEQNSPEEVLILSKWNSTTGEIIYSQNFTDFEDNGWEGIYAWGEDLYLVGTIDWFYYYRVVKLRNNPAPPDKSVPGYSIGILLSFCVLGVSFLIVNTKNETMKFTN